MFGYIDRILEAQGKERQDLTSLVNSGWFQVRAAGEVVLFKGPTFTGGLSSLEAVPINACCPNMMCLIPSGDMALYCDQCKDLVTWRKSISLISFDSRGKNQAWRASEELLDAMAPIYSALGAFESILCASEVITLVQKYAKLVEAVDHSLTYAQLKEASKLAYDAPAISIKHVELKAEDLEVKVYHSSKILSQY